MKELVVISGKGGTGKTSVVASLATLAKQCVLVDCDVDAADLHLIFDPKVVQRENFVGGSKARIKPGHCTVCGKCEELCRFDAIYFDGPGNGRIAKTFRVQPTSCEGCGVCVDYCDENAIEFAPAVCGQWFVSETRCGPMVHAKLGIAAENSGKLVTQVRRTAQEVAHQKGLELIICDGSPGIGCPVIASLTGASLALFVVEPTVSGIHDFRRIAELTARLDVPGLLVVNKSDLNREAAEGIEQAATRFGILPVGRIPYDRAVTHAQVACKTVVEASNGDAAKAICEIWKRVKEYAASAAASGVSNLVQIRA
jgi:MinD superfamily P-loop ATPase